MTTEIGRLGVWAALDGQSPDENVELAQQLERWGYSALWIPEAVGRDPFTFLGYLAGQTEKLVLATGIANIYARDPMTMKAVHKTLSELAPGRFVLGIGVSPGGVGDALGDALGDAVGDALGDTLGDQTVLTPPEGWSAANVPSAPPSVHG